MAVRCWSPSVSSSQQLVESQACSGFMLDSLHDWDMVCALWGQGHKCSEWDPWQFLTEAKCNCSGHGRGQMRSAFCCMGALLVA